MRVIIGGRQSGKTTAAIKWLKEGVEIDSYPGWSRIILTTYETEANHLRKSYQLEHRQVFNITEWQTVRTRAGDVEVLVENVDTMLYWLTLGTGTLVMATMTAEGFDFLRGVTDGSS